MGAFDKAALRENEGEADPRTQLAHRMGELTDLLNSENVNKMVDLQNKLEEPIEYKPDAISWAVRTDQHIRGLEGYTKPDIVWEYGITDTGTETHDDDGSSAVSAGPSGSQ